MVYSCAYCSRGRVERLPANCPACGQYLSVNVSSYEAEQVRLAYNSSAQAERIAALENKHGFFVFLRGLGLTTLASKLASMAWQAIRSLFGFG